MSAQREAAMLVVAQHIAGEILDDCTDAVARRFRNLDDDTFEKLCDLVSEQTFGRPRREYAEAVKALGWT